MRTPSILADQAHARVHNLPRICFFLIVCAGALCQWYVDKLPSQPVVPVPSVVQAPVLTEYFEKDPQAEPRLIELTEVKYQVQPLKKIELGGVVTYKAYFNGIPDYLGLPVVNNWVPQLFKYEVCLYWPRDGEPVPIRPFGEDSSLAARCRFEDDLKFQKDLAASPPQWWPVKTLTTSNDVTKTLHGLWAGDQIRLKGYLARVKYNAPDRFDWPSALPGRADALHNEYIFMVESADVQKRQPHWSRPFLSYFWVWLGLAALAWLFSSPQLRRL